MSVGNQGTRETVDTALTSYAVQLRTICQSIVNLQLSLVKLGAAGLAALPSDKQDPYTADEAALALAKASYMNTVAGVYYGTATQSDEFPFNDALADLIPPGT